MKRLIIENFSDFRDIDFDRDYPVVVLRFPEKSYTFYSVSISKVMSYVNRDYASLELHPTGYNPNEK